MKKYLSICMPLLVASLLLISCGNSDKVKQPTSETEEHEHKEDEHETAGSNMALLTEKQLKTIGITLGTVEEKQLTAALKTNGILKVPNQNKASINSVYTGVIRSLLVQPGNLIRKGQILATITNPQFIQVQSDLLNVNSKIQLAELELKRQQELNAGNAGALKNLQAAESEIRTLQTMKSTLTQQIQLMGINPATLLGGKLVSELTIKSPISGVVSNVAVKMGSYVDVTTVIAEIVDNSSLHLDLFVFEKDLPRLKNNQIIHFTITNNPGKEYDAKIFSLGSSFEGDSKAVTVHAMVEGDKNGLIEGMSVTAAVSLEKAIVSAVPDEAIVTVGGLDYIFVKVETQPKDGNVQFERIPVARGGTDIGYTEITPLKQIPADMKIVTKGAFFVSAKMTNTEGHEH